MFVRKDAAASAFQRWSRPVYSRPVLLLSVILASLNSRTVAPLAIFFLFYYISNGMKLYYQDGSFLHSYFSLLPYCIPVAVNEIERLPSWLASATRCGIQDRRFIEIVTQFSDHRYITYAYTYAQVYMYILYCFLSAIIFMLCCTIATIIFILWKQKFNNMYF